MVVLALSITGCSCSSGVDSPPPLSEQNITSAREYLVDKIGEENIAWGCGYLADNNWDVAKALEATGSDEDNSLRAYLNVGDIRDIASAISLPREWASKQLGREPGQPTGSRTDVNIKLLASIEIERTKQAMQRICRG